MISRWSTIPVVMLYLLSFARSCPTLRPRGLQPTRLLCPWDPPGKSTGLGCHFLLQGIFPTQGSNPTRLHWQADSLQLSRQGSPAAIVTFHKFIIFLEVGRLNGFYGLKSRYLQSHVPSRGFRGECACMPSRFSRVQLFVTLCDLMDYSPPGSSFHGILQTRIPAWVAISFSRGSSRPRDHTHVSYVSPVHGILQARILEWVSTPSSRGSPQPRD